MVVDTELQERKTGLPFMRKSCYLLCIHMGGCQKYGPFLGTLNIRCRVIIGTQKGTLILTTTHIMVTHLGFRTGAPV